MKLHDLLTESVDRAVLTQRADGSFPPGRNGPVAESMTPVRMTAKWVRGLCHEYELTGRRDHLERIRRAGDYLRSERPSGATFHCRTVDGKDQCNGLIGQAYPIIALSMAADALEEDAYRKIAAEVFALHPFDPEIGIWRRVEIDGTVLSIDRTFNHQLWFAVAGSTLADIDQIDQEIRQFLDRLETTLNESDGLIEHQVRPTLSATRYAGMLTDSFKRPLVRTELLTHLRPPRSARALEEKARNYQSVNLFGIALLARRYPRHDIWDHPKLEATLEYIRTDAYRTRIEENGHGFQNKATGFQNAVALETFDRATAAERQWWVERQLEWSYDHETASLGRGAVDPVSMAGNCYIVAYLPNMELTVDLGDVSNVSNS